MSKKKKIASVAFTGAAAAAATGLNAAPALAANGTWHIDPGGGYTAVNTAPAILNANGISLICDVGTAAASGSLSGDGRQGAGAQLGTIATADFGTSATPCTLFGFGFVAHLHKGLTLHGSDYNDPVTTGRIGDQTTSGISASVEGTNFPCHIEIRGSSLPGNFNNDGGLLTINPEQLPNLAITSVPASKSCLGLVHTGDAAWFSAVYNTTPMQTVSATDP